MKKNLLLLIIITLFVTGCGCTKKENKDIVKLEENSFTITDNKTIVEVKIINKGQDSVEINKINAYLYDENGNQISIMPYTKKFILNGKNEKTIQIISEDKYTNTSSVKFKAKY